MYTHVHCFVLKNDPNYVNFFTRMISNFRYKWPPGLTPPEATPLFSTLAYKLGYRAVASLTGPGGQEFHFPHFFLKF